LPKIGISSVNWSGGGHAFKLKMKSHFSPENSLKVSNYSQLISIESIFQAWEEFKKGKRNKKDVQLFERHLEDNIFDLYFALTSKNYKHGGYFEFYVNDPKRRHIHKAKVSDRIVHHLLYKYLYEIFDKKFIYDSYSCRKGKGTHKAVKRLEKLTKIVSLNYTRECWALKLDVKKFFDSIDHNLLKDLVHKNIKDKNINQLIDEVIDSFHSEVGEGKGIPLGNVSSQIFANIYLNELDQFLKHDLKIRYCLRYADDFIILDNSKVKLLHYINIMKSFLDESLKLELHPKKVIYRKLSWGIDFCGYIVLPHYMLPRTKTKRRIVKKVTNETISTQALDSYVGYLSHAKSYKIQQVLKNIYFLNNENF